MLAVVLIFLHIGTIESGECQYLQDTRICSTPLPSPVVWEGLAWLWQMGCPPGNGVRETWLLAVPSLVIAPPERAGQCNNHTVKLPCADLVKVCRLELARKILLWKCQKQGLLHWLIPQPADRAPPPHSPSAGTPEWPRGWKVATSSLCWGPICSAPFSGSNDPTMS